MAGISYKVTRRHYKYLAWLGLTILVLAVLPFTAQAASKTCASYLYAKRGLLNDQMVLDLQTDTKSAHEITWRGLSDYYNALSIESVIEAAQSNPDFHYIDVGGGAGLAGLQSFIFMDPNKSSHLNYNSTSIQALKVAAQHNVSVISYENIFDELVVGQPKGDIHYGGAFPQQWRKLLIDVYDQQTKAGKYKYLTGRFFEDIPEEELSKADLITDYYGAFSYSARKIEVLIKMAKLLKPGGQAAILTKQPLITLSQNGKELTYRLQDLLRLNPVPGLFIMHRGDHHGGLTAVISMSPQAGTIAALEDLARHLQFEKAVAGEHLPPQFYYRLNSH